MGRDGLQVGVQIRKFVIISTRICYRSVCNHPFFVGILLLLLFLYRSSPFLFSILVSFSPVLVCTAVLLGTLLSFGEPKFPLIEQDDEKTLAEIKESKTGSVENTICFEKDENIDRVSEYTELGREIVERTMDEEPLLDNIDTVGKFDVAHSSMPTDQNSREIEFGKQPIDEVNSEFENLEIEKKSSLDDPKIQVGVDGGLCHDEVHENGFSGKSPAENIEDYKSAEGSVDTQIRDQLDSSTGSWERLDDVLEDSLSPVQNVDASSSHDEILDNTEVQAQNFEGYKSVEGSVDAKKTNQLDSSARSWEHSDDVLEDTLSPGRKVQAAVLAQLRNQLEFSIGSWNHFDVVVENRSFVAQKVQAENSEDYKSAEGSVDTQNSDQLESSFKAWNQLGFDRDDDHDDDEDGSDSGSDGAESSSPDASMADIIPMLDELHPLLDDENPQTSNLSHQSSVHSDYGSDQKEEEDGDIQSDDQEEDEEEEEEGEEETQGSKEDREKSAISWTEDDQKNLMDLGTSELERNQRLESLIARRRARRMMVERNLIDLDSMDLQFQVAPISTTRRNPFDLPHDSYDDLGLPPIPGSAPSILMPRRNPFDLPYDSSEEKPDLMADSFQQEFMELYYQGESSNPREAVFRRNETFSMGSSSAFNFGTRVSRFRPYFVPERTDSDMMSYTSSLQRQSSELSESKASSAPDIESPYAVRDGEERKRDEHEFGEEMERGSEIDQASLLAELGSQSSDDLHSLLDQERDFVPQVPEIELGRAGNSPAEVSHTFDTQTQLEASMEERHNTSSSSSSTPKEYSDLRVEDVNEGLVNWELSQADNVENIDTLVKHSLEPSISDIPSEHSLEASDFNHGTEFGDDHPKEPVYDSSPHAIKNRSSSSISSDLHIERSEIHLCQLSSVGRDLLMTEEPKVHEDAEQCVSDEKHGVDGNDQVLLSEVLINSESSVVPVHELHSSVDSSEVGLVEDKSSDSRIPQDEEMLILNREDDDTGVYMEGKLDTIESEDDKGSAIHEKSFEDPILTSEEKDSSILEYSVSPVQSELFSLTGELRDETRMENEDQQFLESSSNLVNHDNDMVEKLVSALGESLDFLHDSAIECPNGNPEEQDSSITHREVEDVGQVNNVDETSNIFTVEEPKENISPDPLQNDQPSFKPEEFEDKPVAELDGEEHIDNNLSQELGVSLSNEKITDDFTNDTNEMDENLLSELDVVGDFIVNTSIINAGFDLPEYVVAESIPDTENPSFDDTLLGANFDPQNFEPMTEITESNFPGFEESNLDSHGGNSSIGLPVEAQSTEHIDAEFRSVSEGGVQTSDIEESIEAELIRELLEASLDTEFLQEDIEPGAQIEQADENFENIVESEAKKFDNGEALEQAPEAETEVGSVESPALQVNRDFIEMPELSVVDASVAPAMESSAQVEETFGFFESEPLEKDNEIRGLQDSPLGEGQIERVGSLESPIVEANIVNSVDGEGEIERVESLESLAIEESIIPSFDSDDQIEGVGSKESGPSLIDRESIAPSIGSEDHREKAASLESEPLPIDSDLNGMQESSFVEEIVPSFESERQTERFGLVESESLLIDSEKAPLVEASLVPSIDYEDRIGVDSVVLEPSLTDEGLKEVQKPPSDGEGIESSFKSEDQLEKAASLESEPLPIDRDVTGMQESPLVEEIVPSFESEAQTERFGLMESESLLIDREKAPLVEASLVPSIDSGDQIGIGSVELEPPLIDEGLKEVREPLSDGDSIEPSLKSEDQLEKAASLESEPLPIDSDVHGMQESPFVEEIVPSFESEAQTERFGVVESESLLIDREKAPLVEASLVPSIDSGDQIRIGSMELEPSLIDEGLKEVQEPFSDGESIEPSLESEDQLEKAASLESEPLPIDSDVKEIQESHVDREIAPSTIESEDETERFESLLVDREVKEVQESPVAEANIEPSIASSGGSHHQSEVAPHVEVVQVQALVNNELASQKQSHGESHLEFSSSDSGED